MPEKATRRPLDFTNVKESGGINPARVEAGDYKAKIVEVRDEEVKNEDSTNKGQPVWNFIFQLSDKRSATYPYRCTLVENQLWKVRNVLIAAGKQVPQKRVQVDPNNVIGVEVGITLEDHDYKGRESSQITAIFPAAELAEDVADDLADTDDPVSASDADEGDLDLDDL